MKLRRPDLIVLVVLSAIAAYWGACEWIYSKQIEPEGISSVADYSVRFGRPHWVVRMTNEEETQIAFFRERPTLPLIVACSGGPAYIFSESGRFLEWHSDPADDGFYASRQQWQFGKRLTDPEITLLLKKYET